MCRRNSAGKLYRLSIYIHTGEDQGHLMMMWHFIGCNFGIVDFANVSYQAHTYRESGKLSSTVLLF